MLHIAPTVFGGSCYEMLQGASEVGICVQFMDLKKQDNYFFSPENEFSSSQICTASIIK